MKQKSLLKHLIYSYMLIVLLVLFVLSVVIGYSSIEKTKKQIQIELEDYAELTSAQLGFVVQNMNFISINTLSKSETIAAMAKLATGELKGTEEMIAYTAVETELENYAIVSSIYHITYFNDAGYIATSDRYNINYNMSSRLSSSDWEELDWISTVRNNYGRIMLLPIRNRQLHQNDTRETLMTVRAVRGPQGIAGYLIVETMLEEITDILACDGQYDEALVISDRNGQIIYQSSSLEKDVTDVISKQQDTEWSNLGYFYTCIEDKNIGLRTIVLAPHSVLRESIIQWLSVYVLEAAFILTIAVFAIIWLSRKVTYPLNALGEQLQKTDLNSIQRPHDRQAIYKYAEIERLFSAYNNMQDRLKILINREIEWKTQQSEQKLLILQKQINPHFMYNTLGMIAIMGYESNNHKIAAVCHEFAGLLRYSISEPKNMISTIGEEIAYIRKYLFLMQMRIEKSCTYEIEEDLVVSAEKIPRLSLQPFIENVFVHAYDEHTSIVNIKICTRADGNNWLIVISDNGCGIQKEKLKQLQTNVEQYLSAENYPRDKQKSSSIGIENTLYRMKLYYKDEFSYSIEDGEPGVKISLRGTRKENSEDAEDESINCRR